MRCKKCGKEITEKKSKERGYGPKCWKKKMTDKFKKKSI